jgi:hypothetical protein
VRGWSRRAPHGLEVADERVARRLQQPGSPSRTPPRQGRRTRRLLARRVGGARGSADNVASPGYSHRHPLPLPGLASVFLSVFESAGAGPVLLVRRAVHRPTLSASSSPALSAAGDARSPRALLDASTLARRPDCVAHVAVSRPNRLSVRKAPTLRAKRWTSLPESMDALARRPTLPVSSSDVNGCRRAERPQGC